MLELGSLLGSYVALRPTSVPISTGVDPMTLSATSLTGMLSMWMLLVLAWKPTYYTVMYLYGVVSKNATTPTTYGTLLHTWITNLLGLVL